MKKSLTILSIVCGIHFSISAHQTLPVLHFGSLENGSLASLSFKKAIPDFVWLSDSIGNEISSQIIESGIIEVTGVSSQAHILQGGELSQDAHHLIESASAGKILIRVNIRDSISNEIQTIQMIFMLGLLPELLVSDIKNGDKAVDAITLADIKTITMGFPAFADFNVFFKIIKGSISLSGFDKKGLILEDGILDSTALELLHAAQGRTVTIDAFYTHTISKITRQTTFQFSCK